MTWTMKSKKVGKYATQLKSISSTIDIRLIFLEIQQLTFSGIQLQNRYFLRRRRFMTSRMMKNQTQHGLMVMTQKMNGLGLSAIHTNRTIGKADLTTSLRS